MLAILVVTLAIQCDIPSLLKDLEADEIEVRDRACSRLESQGEGIIPILETCRATSTDSEVVARLGDTIWRIRHTAYLARGGSVVDGWQLLLSEPQEMPVAGTPTILTLELVNRGTGIRKCKKIDSVCYDMPTSRCACLHTDVRVAVRRLEPPEPDEPRDYRLNKRILDVSDLVFLKEGGSQRIELRFEGETSLEVGQYEIRAIFRNDTLVRQKLCEMPDELHTNAVLLRVKPESSAP